MDIQKVNKLLEELKHEVHTTKVPEHTIKSFNQDDWEEITNEEYVKIFDLKVEVTGYLTANLSFDDEDDKKHYKYFKKKCKKTGKEQTTTKVE